MFKSLFWKPYSHLLIVGDNVGWVIDEEAKALITISQKLGIVAKRIKRLYVNLPQAVHYTSQFSLNEPSIYKSRSRISVDYYHGKPEQGENFQKCFNSLEKNHEKISRVRVSTREMEGVIKSSGIDPAKVMRIPIGIDLNVFKPRTQNSKFEVRDLLGIPRNAVVIGSFQKDGVGWAEGLEPKLIKGPDVFLEVIGKLKRDIPNLWILLSGPARGFVKSGLDSLGVPYRHQYLDEYKDLSNFYEALDLYLITSREEGGPKACLEAMAKGVPLVTTAVGQCQDLVINEQNGMMAPIDDVSELHRHVMQIIDNKDLEKRLIKVGLKTAHENSYESQLPLWKEYLAPLIN